MGIDGFQILRGLGEGAFASVHKVTRKSDGKTYALKKVDVSSLDDKELVSALNEIRLLASFAHPRIVRLYETFMDGNNLCIVMEYCGWGDLAMKIKRYVKRREYIDERVIWVYLIQILEGLKALHERNVLHRDLKPANCFLAEDGSIKIGDMNVSKVMKDGNAKTQIGTPYYMSPEIWSRRPYNYATDIWSLGCLIYELCTLRPPFLGNNMSELKTAVLGGHFNPIPSVYSRDLGLVIARMLTPAAKDRPTAAQALAYPEVHARKCLVKNVLKEEDLRPAPSLLSSVSLQQQQHAAEDAVLLMPTIHISSLRELALKLPGPCYPTDPAAEPPTPTTPLMLAHDASPVNEEEAAGAPPPPRPPHQHRRDPSIVPVNMDKRAGAVTPPPLSHERRRSTDLPPAPLPRSLPGGGGNEAGAAALPFRRAPSPTRPSTSSSSSGGSRKAPSSSHHNATPVGDVAVTASAHRSSPVSLPPIPQQQQTPGSVKSVLQAARAGESPVPSGASFPAGNRARQQGYLRY